MKELEEGIILFNEGMHIEAHEAWERVWVNLAETPEKHFIQGMIMIAAAIHKYKKKEYPGTTKLLEKGLNYMKENKAADVGLDKDAFITEVESFREKFLSSMDSREIVFPGIRKWKK